jgi:periplasmic divalent cation tolerance protein
MNEAGAIVVLVTAASTQQAESIARTLVAERLAACVNLLPGVRSIYRWQGQVADQPEVLLVIKTRRELFTPLSERVKALHSYEVPEVIALDVVEGSEPYLRWLTGETT